MGWYSLDLLKGEDEAPDFDAMWRAAWKIVHAEGAVDVTNAVFRRSGDNPAVFFSPAARRLADAFGATTCERPVSDGLQLVAGDDRAWEILFPGCTPPATIGGGPMVLPSEYEVSFEHTHPSGLDDFFRPTSPSQLG